MIVNLRIFLKQAQLNQLSWNFHRIVDIYGEDKKPYLLDCTILFTGMLHHHFHIFFQKKELGLTVHHVIRYCINRLSGIVEDVSSTGEQLYDPKRIKEWFPTDASDEEQQQLRKKMLQSIYHIKKLVCKERQNESVQIKWMELLDFLQDEIHHSKQPRMYLVECVLNSLAMCKDERIQEELKTLKGLIQQYID